MSELTVEKQIERAEQAIRVLRSLTPHERRKHFDMATFGIKTDCGTVACAAGHCGLDPWFRRRGFKLEFKMCVCCDPPQLMADIGDVEGFFGNEVSGVFYNGHSRSVSAVIREIKESIEDLKNDR